MSWILVIVAVGMAAAFVCWRYFAWLTSLACDQCGASLADAYRRARDLEEDTVVALADIAQVHEIEVFFGPWPPRVTVTASTKTTTHQVELPAQRFPCCECGVVHEWQPGTGIRVAVDQDFSWPDPESVAEAALQPFLQCIQSDKKTG